MGGGGGKRAVPLIGEQEVRALDVGELEHLPLVEERDVRDGQLPGPLQGELQLADGHLEPLHVVLVLPCGCGTCAFLGLRRRRRRRRLLVALAGAGAGAGAGQQDEAGDDSAHHLLHEGGRHSSGYGIRHGICRYVRGDDSGVQQQPRATRQPQRTKLAS